MTHYNSSTKINGSFNVLTLLEYHIKDSNTNVEVCIITETVEPYGTKYVFLKDNLKVPTEKRFNNLPTHNINNQTLTKFLNSIIPKGGILPLLSTSERLEFRNDTFSYSLLIGKENIVLEKRPCERMEITNPKLTASYIKDRISNWIKK